MEAKKLTLEQLDRIDIESFKKAVKTPINVVLNDIRSALNVGSFFRTSDAFVLKHLYLCGITATPPHKEILKTAIGATSSVEWSYHKDIIKLLQELQNSSTIISIEQTDQSVSLEKIAEHVDIESNITLVFGNEVQGVSQEVINLSDMCVEIPQFGTKHSLNVSVCGGIVIWEFFKLLSAKIN